VSTLYVDDDYNETTPGWNITHFNKIQDGVNASSDGDTIFVYNGEYVENLKINKQIILQGESNESTIITARDKGYTLEITDDYVQILKFKIVNSYGISYSNIRIESNNSLIENNILYGENGILILGSNNVLNRNIISGFVYLFENYNKILYNTILNSIDVSSSNNDIMYNIIDCENKLLTGIEIGEFGYNYDYANRISHNIIKNCKTGINVYNSKNEFLYNDFTSNEANANVYFIGRCKWYHNYWGKSDRFHFNWSINIPRPIISRRLTNIGYWYFIDFDWSPALKPNCDFGNTD
jgi:hypothetical protein